MKNIAFAIAGYVGRPFPTQRTPGFPGCFSWRTAVRIELINMGAAASMSEQVQNTRDVPNELQSWTALPQLAEGTDSDGRLDYRAWEFDIWRLDEEQLLQLSMLIANDLRFPQTFGFGTSIWCNFVWEAQRLMNTSINPYHSYRHVMDVAQTCACIVKTFSASFWLSDLDVFALYVSAIVHDLEHPGTNNVYQVNACTPLAIRYNDISVLENHHCARAFDVFMLPQCNITSTLKPDQRKFLRKTIIALVLTTDMTQHFSLRAELDAVITRHSKDGAPTKLDEKESLTVLKSIIHTSDISNTAKPWDICKRWSDLVLQEFFAQGDREKAEGLPVSMNCDRDTTKQDELSMNFTDFIVAPLFFSMAKLLPKMITVCKTLEVNRAKWHELYIARTMETPDDAARAEALQKWQDRAVQFSEKMVALEKTVEASWTVHPTVIERGESSTELKQSHELKQ